MSPTTPKPSVVKSTPKQHHIVKLYYFLTIKTKRKTTPIKTDSNLDKESNDCIPKNYHLWTFGICAISEKSCNIQSLLIHSNFAFSIKSFKLKRDAASGILLSLLLI